MTEQNEIQLQELRHSIERLMDKMDVMEREHKMDHEKLQQTTADTNKRLTWMMSLGTAAIVLLTFWSKFSAVFGV